MNESSNPRRPSRYLDRWFADRGIMMWTHLILAMIAGATFVISATASHRLLAHGGLAGWVGRGPGPFLAIAFFIAALPYLISYKCNVNQAAINRSRLISIIGSLLSIASSTRPVRTMIGDCRRCMRFEPPPIIERRTVWASPIYQKPSTSTMAWAKACGAS